MFERFSERSIKVIMLAQEEARRLGHNLVSTEQIFLGLTGEGKGVAAEVLKSMGVNLKDARIEVERIIGRGSGSCAVEIPFSNSAKRVLELAVNAVRQMGHKTIHTEHLFLGLLHEIEEGDEILARVLERFDFDSYQARENLLLALDNRKSLAQIKSLQGSKKNQSSRDISDESSQRQPPQDSSQRLEKFRQRRKIFQTLSSLPAAQFNEVVFGLEVPPGNVPPSSSSQADRVAALIEWVTSPVGCGLEHLEEVLQLIIGSNW